MGYIDHGGFQAFAQLDDLRAHLYPQLGIQIAQRFIKQEHFGVAHNRPPKGNALSLSTRQLSWTAMQQRYDIQYFGATAHRCIDLFLGNTAHFQTKRHILIDIHVRIKRIVLKDHSDIPVLDHQIRN